MNRRVLYQAVCLMICACTIMACRNTTPAAYKSSQPWFAKNKKAVRQPKVSKPKRNSYSGKVHQSVLNQANSGNTSVVIDIGAQKGYLLVDGSIAVQTQISTARPGKYTPRGTFSMTERVRTGKISTIYNVGMPYWMRLDGTSFGVHAGYVPGYPASAGCIRLPYDVARLFYDNTRSGTRVRIYSNWSGH